MRKLTVSDGPLKQIRAWTDKQERNYFWKDGLIFHRKVDEWANPQDRIVVPEVFRHKVLVLAHDHSGHLGVAKVRQLVGRFYTWTGMYTDIVRYCAACSVCQVNKKTAPKPAPLQNVPVLTEPWERVAFDIVGPLPRARDGSKYVLTSICLASRYPDAVTLKDISAESVAEGMTEIWSRRGLPIGKY